MSNNTKFRPEIAPPQLSDNAFAITPGMLAKVKRRLAPALSRRERTISLKKAIISLTFDDFPQSIMEHALPLLNERGWKATFYVAAGLENVSNHLGKHYSRDDLLKLKDQGHEIACHTYHHVNVNEISSEQMDQEIRMNAAALKDMGVKASLKHFAYPFGETNGEKKNQLSHDFTSMRGIIPGIHREVVDLNQLNSVPVFSGLKLQVALDYIHKIAEAPGWLTLFTHDIRTYPSPWGCTPEDFKLTIEAMEKSGSDILTIGDALAEMGII